MVQTSTKKITPIKTAVIYFVSLLLCFTAVSTWGQVSSAGCNAFSPVVNPTFGNLTVTSSSGFFGGDQFSAKANVINNNLADAATYSFIGAGSAYLEVKDNAATTTNVYPAGSFAGFAVNDGSLLTAFGTTTITTYLGTTQQESVSTGSLLATAIVSPGISQAGFYTTKSFDRIRVTFAALGIGSVSVYYAVVEKFCQNATSLVCNTPTTLTLPDNPLYINPTNTGVGGICALCSVTGTNNIIDATSTNFATISLPIGVAGSGSVSVKNALSAYAASPANPYFVGYDIDQPALIGAGLLTNQTITTYLAGVQQEQIMGGSLLSAGSSLLNGTGRTTVGFLATKAFDEVKLTAGALAGVLTTVNVYGLQIEKFCAGPDVTCATNSIPANTLVNLTYGSVLSSPVYVDGARTGITSAGCAGCSINNTENVINANASTPAEIILTAGVLNTANYAVANAVDTYPAGSYAGFDVETNTFLSAGALGSTTINFFNNGTLVQSGSGANLLLGAQSSLLTGTTRQTIGLVATQPYDEVQISFGQLAGGGLGTIRIYRAVFQKNCANPIGTNCTTKGSFYLKRPDYGVVINAAHTGVSGILGAAATVRDVDNVISPSGTDFATITNTASAGTTSSIAVLDAADVFPAGTFAGFAVKQSNNLISAALLQSIRVTTYLNGVLQESSTTGNLINLTALTTILGPNGSASVGFNTTKAFNEIQLSVSPLVAAGLPTTVDVYGVLVDNRQVCGVLPVDLVSFTAQPQSDRTVLVSWKTSWERNNQHYLIERSNDLLTFQPAGEVRDVAGSSNSINSYRFVDTNPYRGTSYYRLIQVDQDGTRHSYPAQAVILDGHYGVAPNPVVGRRFTLELDEPVSALVQLYDLVGRTVPLEKSQVTPTSVTLSTASSLAPGLYVLTVAERGTLRQYRLVIQ